MVNPADDVGRILLVAASVTATVFPALYSRVAWYRTVLGFALMVQSVALAGVLQIKVLFTFVLVETEHRTTLSWLNSFVLFLIVVATSVLSHIQWKLHREYLRKAKAHAPRKH